MESTKQHLEQQQNQPSGIAGDIRRLKTEGGATAVELREFLGRLKGRSPQEVMGVAAESSLFRSILTATAGCLVLLIVFTILPYAIHGKAGSVSDKTTPAPTPTSDDKQPVPAVTNENTTNETAASPGEPDLERAAEAMGIGGTVEADPNSNPLDSKLDKLLDGIE